MAQPPDPPTRHDRQQQTREALIIAARDVFADVGYHSASLERIAREAGFSKGAVYSNFAGKSALFLAVMDENLKLAQVDAHDPFGEPADPPSTGRETAKRDGFPPEATQGFALATLEFIATAARDEQLAPQLHQRLREVLGYYSSIAGRSRPHDETLATDEVGTLLAALDQGAGLILLAGDVLPDAAVFTEGLRRLLDPARAIAEQRPDD